MPKSINRSKAAPPAKRKLISTLADLIPDDRNANKGTSRGKEMIGRSLRDYGAGRSILIDNKGRIIAGKTVENPATAGLLQDPGGGQRWQQNHCGAAHRP